MALSNIGSVMSLSSIPIVPALKAKAQTISKDVNSPLLSNETSSDAVSLQMIPIFSLFRPISVFRASTCSSCYFRH